MINIYHTVLGMVSTNCYMIVNEDNRQCVIVDPADNAKDIYDMVTKSRCELAGILLTHGHFDHILAADELRNISGAKIYAGEEEAKILASPQYNLSGVMGRTPVTLEADEYLKDEQEFSLAGIDFRAIHTPGHTAGGMCYYIEEAKSLISGDTLFAESVGRTDFPTGSMSQIVNSIKSKLFVLPDNTKVFPGHGEATSIAYEKQCNPYCQ